MAVDRNEMSDELAVELSDENGPKQMTVGDRPSASAPKDDWLNYVVALGASREYLTNTTHHYSLGANSSEENESGEPGYIEDPVFTKEELMELADRLTGNE